MLKYCRESLLEFVRWLDIEEGKWIKNYTTDGITVYKRDRSLPSYRCDTIYEGVNLETLTNCLINAD